MTARLCRRLAPICALLAMGAVASGADGEVLPPINGRFATADASDTPEFQKHVVPLFGKLGCNGRACHGSFQGQGGFQLSLFGYDFEMDHKSLTEGEEPRTDQEVPEDSLMLMKPTLSIPHKGGKRMEVDSWEYRVLLKWVAGGAHGVEADDPQFVRLEVTPEEIVYSGTGESTQLKAVAVWSDGSREDVTPLCRFQTNDEQIANVSETGLIQSGEPGDTHVVVFYDAGVVPVPVLRPVSDKVGPNYPDVPTPTAIDRLVVEKLRKLGVVPAELSSDAEFLRRVSLDITGSLPTAQEVEAFLADTSADKRARKIDELLERPSYVAWWTTRLCDITGNSEDELVNVTPVLAQTSQDWYDWIYRRVEQNTPYDELIAGIVLAKGREEGESYLEYTTEMSEIYQPDGEAHFADRETMPHFWARRTLRQPAEKALSFAYSFLGIRIQCAQCHKHPFDQWTQDDYKQFTNFFTRVNFGRSPDARDEYMAMVEELDLAEKKGNDLRKAFVPLLKEGKTVPFEEVYVLPPQKQRKDETNDNKKKNKKTNKEQKRGGAQPSKARLLGSDVVQLNDYDDPREALMQWLRSADNPYFARALVNRVWSAYFNVGIVEPPDDLSLANPPSNKALLDHLAAEFIAHDYDMKWLHREIAGSRTYQLSWQPNQTNRNDERNFSRSIPRRLPAEVAYDAVQQATASDERAADMQQNVAGRAISIPGAGRRSRNGSKYALTIFGKSARESNCDCDRSNESSLLQTIFLRNDEEMLTMVDRPKDGWIAQLAGAKKQNARNGDDSAERAPNLERSAKRLEADRQRLTALEQELSQHQAAGKENQAKQVQQRIAQMKKRIAKQHERLDALASAESAESSEAQAEPAAAVSLDVNELIERAYLRTLCRPPAEAEAARAREHFAQSESVVEGARDLVWALLNTKEFIVNH